MMKRILLVLAFLAVSLMPVPAIAMGIQIGDKITIGELEATVVGFKDGQPVYQALITPDIHSTTSDGNLSVLQNGGLYATARSAANAGFKDDTGGWILVQNSLSGGVWLVYRGYLYFDTSSLNGYVVTAANLKLWGSTGGDADTDTIVVQDGMPTYPHDPLVVGDFDESKYAGNYASKSFATWVDNAYNTLSFNAGGIAAINTAGTTKFCLRTSDDINNNQPTGVNGIFITTVEQGDPYEPTLVITFTALTPAIISVAASNIGSTTARLNSTITDDGGDKNCSVRFGYGTTTQLAVNFAAYDTVTAWVAGYDDTDNPFLDVVGLIPPDTYYYRVQVKNELSTITSTDEQTFAITATIDDVTKFLGYPTSSTISLSWVKGAGNTNVRVEYRDDTYPTVVGNGTLIYENTASNYLHTGLTAGKTYYYTAWGESGGTYSSVPGVNMVMSTSAIADTGDDFANPSSPSGWNQLIDYTLLQNLNPFYSVVNGMADDWGMPRENAWLGLILGLCFAGGVAVYIKFHAPALALMIVALLMAGGVLIHLLPTMMIFVVIVMALGAWALRPQGGIG